MNHIQKQLEKELEALCFRVQNKIYNDDEVFESVIDMEHRKDMLEVIA